MIQTKEEVFIAELGGNPQQEIELSYGAKIKITDLLSKYLQAINYTHCCETLKNEGQATLTEYATELINIQENPKDSNKEWKIVLIQNTISKLYETLQTL
jgi:hypothetical protein